MIKFADESWLLSFWLILGMVALALYFISRTKKEFEKYFGGKRAGFLTSSLSYSKRKMHIVLQALAILFFAIALARPLMGARRTEVKQTGLEIIFAVDVSNSMMAEDDKPSRLEHAKHELNHLLDMLGGDRVGIIAFAGSAILVSPMTSDHSAIKMYISSLSPTWVSTQGTNFKEVMEEAVRAFDRGGVEAINGGKPTRVLVVASDGEDNEPGGIAAVEKATKEGIHVFALGFGTAKGAPIPVRDERGNLTGYKKDRNNQPVLSVPSDEGLAKLARAGGGSYYHTTFEETELRQLVADFDKLQKAEFKSQMATDYDEKFQIPLGLGILFALIDFLFGDRKRAAKIWRGRFETGVA